MTSFDAMLRMEGLEEEEQYQRHLSALEDLDYEIDHELTLDAAQETGIEVIREITPEDKEDAWLEIGYTMKPTPARGRPFGDDAIFAPMNRYGVRKFKR